MNEPRDYFDPCGQVGAHVGAGTRRHEHVGRPGEELFGYAKHCADKYGLRSKIRFGAHVVAARFDETAHCWWLELADGSVVSGRYLFSCTGHFSTPQKPGIAGLDDFAGPAIYTMAWDHDQELDGKRVAVIGTGASALQVIPAIAPEVEALTVFQRTPIWVLPRPDAELPAGVQGLFDRLPLTQKWTRLATSVLTGPPQARTAGWPNVDSPSTTTNTLV
ncbi:MAG: NAD(P)/FAD-dependent oxidoreductase [Mycobacterium sp.]|nr:NAD(P)/FAD-dependent oxidoreductase [Mycobacterium sp.]